MTPYGFNSGKSLASSIFSDVESFKCFRKKQEAYAVTTIQSKETSADFSFVRKSIMALDQILQQYKIGQGTKKKDWEIYYNSEYV